MSKQRAEEMRRLYAEGLTQCEVAKKLGVTQGAVSAAVNRDKNYLLRRYMAVSSVVPKHEMQNVHTLCRQALNQVSALLKEGMCEDYSSESSDSWTISHSDLMDLYETLSKQDLWINAVKDIHAKALGETNE